MKPTRLGLFSITLASTVLSTFGFDLIQRVGVLPADLLRSDAVLAADAAGAPTPAGAPPPAGAPATSPLTPSYPASSASSAPASSAPTSSPTSSLPSATSAPNAQPTAQPMAPSTAQLEDYTDRIKMLPGIVIVFPIRNGCDRNGRATPDYSMVVQIEPKAKDCAFSYKWTMAGLGATGVRAVSQASKNSSRKISFFYKPGEYCDMVGYTNAVSISDDMFRDLKSGGSSPIELDGPFGQATRHAASIPLPQYVAAPNKPPDDEEIPIQVDEKKVKVRAIKVVGDNPAGPGSPNAGWTYWILDNPAFPMIVKGSGPFTWDACIINANGRFDGNIGDKTGNGGLTGAREGKRIVQDLKKNGVATTNAILFDFDSDKLKPSAKPILNEISTYLTSNPAVKIAVQGHCDNVGSHDYNINLSRRRAASVRLYLVKAGIDGARLQSEGYGFTKPVASNKTAAGRARNRRVVFQVIAK